MKTIYKSAILESAILAVSLSLQAEVNDGSDVTTVGVDASTLDGLRVELASPKVSGAIDLIASGAAVVSGSTIAVTLGGFEELATLEQVTYRLTVKARYGTQVRTLYALDITVPRGTLAGGTQEYEDSIAVVSTFGDGGGEFPDDYARQGDNPNATNTAIYEAMQGLTGLEPDVAAGKIALAAAITAKGVQSSSDETLQQMAVDVQQITQSPITIDGGEMYAKQLYGVQSNDVTPGYWNLYDVMAQLLSDGRLENYGGILLAEYYKGYDSLALSGAGAGGAYVVSDIENGAFKMYTEDTTHVWNTEDDGKGNRWVAYCFAEENHNFQITDTNTSPRSIFIGRKVGIITSLVNGRCSEIVVPDGNFLGGFYGNFTQNWNKNIRLRNIACTTGTMIYGNQASESIYAEVTDMGGTIYYPTTYDQLKSVIVKFKKDTLATSSIISTNGTKQCGCAYAYVTGVKKLTGNGLLFQGIGNNNAVVILDGLYELAGGSGTSYGLLARSTIKELRIIGMEIADASLFYEVICQKVYIAYKDGENDKTKSVVLRRNTGGSVDDFELKSGWCKPLTISAFSTLIEDGTTNNITEHILKRLKQDEAGCGDGVTITLGATNLAKLTSQESIDLLDALTNTYGYTFA